METNKELVRRAYELFEAGRVAEGLIQGVHSYPYDAEAQETFWG
ncbi:hypothetical protein [Sinomonas terrae]|nr:hypothetical protein [Sinomonas terrae]HKU11449.1 hypothetical protein [Sinomonas sp.]